MCGIAGAFSLNGQVAPSDVAIAMGELMTHRGPDNFGSYVDQRIAMTHNRLSFLDLSPAGNQPFCNDRYALSYNGEIYNFKALRAELERSNEVRFRSTSDTEVLFHCLATYGIEATLEKLRGMFAFAFFDKHESVLYLARDRMGIKPLYYVQRDKKIYFASEIKALSQRLGLLPDPVRTLFAANNMAEKSTEFTLFKGVKSVGPGSYVVCKPGEIPTSHTYYDVVDEFDPDYYNELARYDGTAIVDTFDELLVASLESMMVSDAPVGAFVSGGIDSSLLSALAAKRNSDIKLFTANIKGKYSEYSDVETLSRYLGKPVFSYDFEPEMMIRDWARVTYFYECPIVIHVNSIPFSNIANVARETGVKAVLTGEGADELFLGYPPLLTQRYEALATAPVNAIKSLYKLAPSLYRFLFPENVHTPLTFLNKLVQGFELQSLQTRADASFRGLSQRDQREQFMTIKMLREHLTTLLYRNDRMGMMASIEARFPFLDEDIIKFAINLPSKFKIGRSTRFHNFKHPFLIDKWVVRRSAAKHLPKALVNKKKNGFPMFGHKFLKIGPNFFRDGWVADSLGLSNNVQKYFVETQDPYLVSKLASVEVFGRLYGMGMDIDRVGAHVASNASIIRN